MKTSTSHVKAIINHHRGNPIPMKNFNPKINTTKFSYIYIYEGCGYRVREVENFKSLVWC